MSKMSRLVVVLALFVPSIVTSAGTIATQTTATPRLIEQRQIEIPDSRIIGISPDGTAIAASSIDMNRLCIYEVETLAQRVCADLTPLDARLRLDDVAWSPDSTKLALAEDAFRVFRDGDLWLMDAVTGELTDLTDDGVNASLLIGDQDVDFDELFLDVSPTWLPGGSGVTFSRSTWRDGNFSGNQIMTVPVTGGEPELLTTVTPEEPAVVYYDMRWTADGSTLIYSINHNEMENEENGIWRIGADGAGKEKLASTDPVLGPPLVGGISPDGETVLLYYAYSAGNVGTFAANLYALLDVPTGTLTRISVESLEAPDAAGVWPATLSPDGRFVLYATRLTNPEFQIIMEPVDGGAETNLIPEGLHGATTIVLTAPLTWSNTGTMLMGGDHPSNATLLTIEGGTDFEPVDATAAATPVGPGARNEPATPSATPGGFEPGDTVVVNSDGVPLWSSPNDDGQLAAILAFGTELVVVGTTESSDGELWVAVTDLETGTIGYVRAEFLDPAG